MTFINSGTCTSPFGNTLIVGAGPAAINIAVNVSRGWCDKLGLVNRKGTHTNRLKENIKVHGKSLKSRYQNHSNQHLNGEAKIDNFYGDYQEIENQWETLIICTPSDSYIEVIHNVSLEKLTSVKMVLLISPGIGSNFLIEHHFMKEMKGKELISLSAYYAATKYETGEINGLSVLTKALKKRIYLASSRSNGVYIKHVSAFIESLGVQCQIVSSPIDAESKNITTYVHPPLFMNSFAMEQILRKDKSIRSMYKIYPEGPITQHSIRAMVRLWKEISAVVSCFGAKPINLLQFLNDDNYPVHENTLSREDIEGFQNFSEEKQEYLLYIRYSAILIDPFSSPDKNGKHFEFSAVPFKQASVDSNGNWNIPRIPLEDYQKLKIIYGLAQGIDIEMPQALGLLQTFEREAKRFSIENRAGFSNYNSTIDYQDKNIAQIAFEKRLAR